MLSRVHIQNFRSLYDISLQLKPITIIIGPNASGKSNIFRALRFLYDGIAGDRLDWQAYDGQIDHLTWYGVDDYGQRPLFLDFSLGFSANDTLEGVYEASFRCGDYLSVQKEGLSIFSSKLKAGIYPYYERDIDKLKTFTGKIFDPRKKMAHRKVRSLRVLHMRDEGPNFRNPIASLIYQQIVGWRFVDINLAQARREFFIPEEPEDVPPLAGDGSNLSAFLYALNLKQTEDYETIVNTMADLIELPQKILVSHDSERGGQSARYGFIEQPFGENRLIPPSSMSDGTIRLLALLSLILGDRSVKLACLEEPDQGMHPRLMFYLADILRQISHHTDGKNAEYPQVIITTHNPEFMDCFDLDTDKEFLQVYVAERNEDGKTLFTSVTDKEFAPWLKKYRLGEAVRRSFV